MIDSTTTDFSVPQDFLGKEIVIRLAVPIFQNGLSFPEIQATLLENLSGALLLKQDDGSTTVLPKSRVWSLSLASNIAVFSKPLLTAR